MREDDIIIIIYSQTPNALNLNEQTRTENIYMIYSS